MGLDKLRSGLTFVWFLRPCTGFRSRSDIKSARRALEIANHSLQRLPSFNALLPSSPLHLSQVPFQPRPMQARHEHPEDHDHEDAPPPLIRVRVSNDSLVGYGLCSFSHNCLTSARQSQLAGHGNREVVIDKADNHSIASTESLQDDEGGAFLHRRARAFPRRRGIIVHDGGIQPMLYVDYRQAAPAGAPPAAGAAPRQHPVSSFLSLSSLMEDEPYFQVHTLGVDRATSFGILALCAALSFLLIVTVLMLGAVHAELRVCCLLEGPLERVVLTLLIIALGADCRAPGHATRLAQVVETVSQRVPCPRIVDVVTIVTTCFLSLYLPCTWNTVSSVLNVNHYSSPPKSQYTDLFLSTLTGPGQRSRFSEFRAKGKPKQKSCCPNIDGHRVRKLLRGLICAFHELACRVC